MVAVCKNSIHILMKTTLFTNFSFYYLFKLFLEFGKVFSLKPESGKRAQALKIMKRNLTSKKEFELFDEVSRKRNSHYLGSH